MRRAKNWKIATNNVASLGILGGEELNLNCSTTEPPDISSNRNNWDTLYIYILSVSEICEIPCYFERWQPATDETGMVVFDPVDPIDSSKWHYILL